MPAFSIDDYEIKGTVENVNGCFSVSFTDAVIEPLRQSLATRYCLT